MKKLIPLASLALLLCSAPAAANDSIATVDTYGIHFKKSSSVVMASERLFISREKIEVDYIFINESAQDVVETVVFPMPREPGFVEINIPWPYAEVDTYKQQFSVLVDGRPVSFREELRAFLPDSRAKLQDVTSQLRALGITDLELAGEHISERVARVLDQAGLWPLDEDITITPWSLQRFYHWEQRFPAGKSVRVQHAYPPLLGGRIWPAEDSGYQAMAQERFCLNKRVWRGKRGLFDNSDLHYILTTGANWAGPIRDFQLVIEKSPYERVSLCWPESELKKVSPVRFEARIADFTPQRDLAVLFYSFPLTDE